MGSETFVRGGPTLTTFFLLFLVDERRDYKIPLKAGHHWPANETTFKWRFAGVPMMA